MSQNIQGGDDNIVPVQANGTIPAVASAAFGTGYKLVAGQTYYAKLGGKEAWEFLSQLYWDAAIILTSVAIEFCAFPGGIDVADLSAIAGQWVKQDAAPPVKGQAVGAGAVFTNSTLAVAGGAAGGATFEIGQTGTRRARMKIVVGGTGGDVRIGNFGKG
jgi:hypothetical protein